jgi:hypothetical protein
VSRFSPTAADDRHLMLAKEAADAKEGNGRPARSGAALPFVLSLSKYERQRGPRSAGA